LRAALRWGGHIAALALIAWLWFAARQRATAFWMMWFLGFLAPVLQLARNPIWVADRYLYIPAIGVFVLCGYLVAALRRRIASPQLQRAVLLIPVAAVVACLWLTTRYLPTWKSNVALWSGAMRTCSGSAYCHDMLGFALRQEANDSTGPDREQTRARLRAAAIEEATISTYLRPAPQKFMRLGDALLDAGDARAFAAYARAQEMMGQLPRENWAQIIKGHYRLGNLPEADRLLSLIRSTGADNPTVLLVQAFVDWKMGRPEQAREAIQKILDMNRLFPAGPDRTRRFVAHYWGDEEEAARMLREVGAP
jgi:hypothetical protein